MTFQIFLKIKKFLIIFKLNLFFILYIKMAISYLKYFVILNTLIPILLLHFQLKLNKFLWYLLLQIPNPNIHYFFCIMETHNKFYHNLTMLFLIKVHDHIKLFFQIYGITIHSIHNLKLNNYLFKVTFKISSYYHLIYFHLLI